MTMSECYQALGGNYKDVLARFRSEERIAKYIIKFLQDQSFHNLQAALETGDADTAFRAAHTLKGVAQNLGLDQLSNSSVQITEALRTKDLSQATALFSVVSSDYLLTIQSIQNYQSNPSN